MSSVPPSAARPAPPLPLPSRAAHSVVWTEPDILHCRAPDVADEGPLRAYYAELKAVAHRHPGPFAQLSDTTHITHASTALERKLHAEFSNEIARTLRNRCVVCVTVIPSAVIRATTTAVLWMLTLPVPVVTAGSVDEALLICRKALGRA